MDLLFLYRNRRSFLLKRVIISTVQKYQLYASCICDNDSFIIQAAINTRDLAKNLVRVRSSNVWSIGIDIRDKKDKTGTVIAQFKNKYGGPGDIYAYWSVPIMVYRKWITAPSKGNYLWRYIRNTYAYTKLTGNKKGVLPNAINN